MIPSARGMAAREVSITFPRLEDGGHVRQTSTHELVFDSMWSWFGQSFVATGGSMQPNRSSAANK